MAFKHIRSAQKQTVGDNIAKHILVEIASYIGSENQPAYPSYRTLAESTEVHYNTVAAKVAYLEEKGFLIVTKDGRKNKYTLGFDCDNDDNGLSHTDYDNGGGGNGSLSQPDCDNVTNNNELSQQIVTALSQLNKRLSQIEGQLSQNSGQLSQPECDLSNRSNRSNKGKKGKATPNNPNTLPLKYPRSQFEQEFNTFQMNQLWPLILAFQETCDMPSDILKFYENIWEVFGYDDFTVDDIHKISGSLRSKRPHDNVWPSNVITEWRRLKLMEQNGQQHDTLDETWASLWLPAFTNSTVIQDWPEVEKQKLRAIGGQQTLMKNPPNRVKEMLMSLNGATA